MHRDNRAFGTFVLGPFTVIYYPYHEIYTRYSIKWQEIELRGQISCPNLDDCMMAYQAALTQHRITEAQASEIRQGLVSVVDRRPRPKF